MPRKPCVTRTTSLLASVRPTLALVSLCLAAAVVHAEEPEKKEEKTVVEAGSMGGIEYTLTLEDGTKVAGKALVFDAKILEVQ